VLVHVLDQVIIHLFSAHLVPSQPKPRPPQWSVAAPKVSVDMLDTRYHIAVRLPGSVFVPAASTVHQPASGEKMP
jgi:hypothetical protein